MLLDVPLEMKADPGDTVALSTGANNDAVARVVHTVRDENWTHQWVGVEITEMSPEFATSLNLLVTSLGVEFPSGRGRAGSDGRLHHHFCRLEAQRTSPQQIVTSLPRPT